jgi:hypothetical protein
MPRRPRKIRRRNSIASSLKYYTPRIVKPKKGRKAYRRKPKHPRLDE